MLNQYYPDSQPWRSEVMGSGRTMLNEVLTNYSSL
jgi:hypothetical protein